MIYSHYLHQKSSSCSPSLGLAIQWVSAHVWPLLWEAVHLFHHVAHFVLPILWLYVPPAPNLQFLQGLMALTTAQLECWEHADAEAKLRPRTSFHWPSPFYETGNTRCEGRHHRSTSWMHQLHGGMRLVALCRPMWQHITPQNDEPMKPQNELAEQLRWQIHGHFGKFLSHCHLVGTS